MAESGSKERAPLAHACTDYNASGQWKKASEEDWRCGRCGFPQPEHEIADRREAALLDTEKGEKGPTPIEHRDPEKDS